MIRGADREGITLNPSKAKKKQKKGREERMRGQIQKSYVRKAALRTASGVCMLLAFLAAPSAKVCAAENGTWALTDDGKHWQYLYAPDDPAEDEWIEDDGKEYYLDSKGYMKTGWVTDKKTGNKYYMGEDGAKCYNVITPDDHFVGDEGLIFKRYDTYRKKAKAFLKKEWKNQQQEQNARKKAAKKAGILIEPENMQTAGFALSDLNWDNYPDLVILDSAENPNRILVAAVWDPEEEEFSVLMESDLDDQTVSSRLWREETLRQTWLLQEENELNQSYFLLTDGELCVELQWQLETQVNDWEELEYYVNGQQTSQEEWYQWKKEAKAEAEAGTQMPLSCVLLTEENIDAVVGHVLTLEEQELWEDE